MCGPQETGPFILRAAVTNYHRLGGLKDQGSALSQLGRLAGQCLLLVGALATALLLIVAQLQSLPQSPHGLLPWASCSYQDSRHIG